MAKIYFDAGHGKYTPGKRSPSGKFEEREWFFNDEVARAFEARMKQYNNVTLVRTDDRTGEKDILLKNRTDLANNAKADLYISFHHNAYLSKWGSHGGTETFYYKGSSEGKKLAQLVQNAMLKAYGLRDRGLKTDDLHITRETNMVAVLTEGGFMDSDIDIKKLRDKKVLQKAGQMIADAVAEYLGLKLKSGASKPAESKPTQSTSTNNSKPSSSATSKPTTSTGSIKVGDKVKIKSSAKTYQTGQTIPASVKSKTYTVQQVDPNRILLKEIYSWVRKSDIEGQKSSSTSTSSSNTSSTSKSSNNIKVGSKVTLSKSATKYATGQNIPTNIKGKKYTVQQVKSDRVLLKEIYSWVFIKDVGGSATSTSTTSSSTTSKPKTYKVGQTVTLKKSATKFATGESILNSAKGKKYKIIQVKSDRVLLDKIMSWVKKSDIS